jgi:hypothetical protein
MFKKVVHKQYLIKQFRKFLQNTAQLCLKTVLKVVFIKRSFLYFEMEVWCPQITKKFGSANRKSTKFHFFGKSQIWPIMWVRKFADCALINFFADRPPLATSSLTNVSRVYLKNLNCKGGVCQRKANTVLQIKKEKKVQQ